ncbi:MAG: penicillin acylase family protein [Gemmatimonadaceae bacterium]
MMRRALPAILLAALVIVGARPIGPLPPLGPLLDPANGVWAAAAATNFPARQQARIPGLRDSVKVLFDDRGVPHVFASNERDAWRALGYVVARDRLFQMEAQTRAASGRLTEWAGARSLETDREARALGLAWGAEKKAAAYDRESPAWAAMEDYAAGVNAWIDGMRPRDLPLEYRLLRARPIRWEAIHTFYFLSRMTLTLGFNDATLRRLRAQGMVGEAAADALFPVNSVIQEPIQPNGQHAPRYDLAELPPPGPPDKEATAEAIDRARLMASLGVPDRTASPDAIGSNNWAVSPSRSASGYALLAGDPHLDLSLPSVWYEMHIVVPGKLDVAGVGFPGMPGVIIGFNRNVAWTFTNTGADVNDYYTETVNDSGRPSQYMVDGKWRKIETRAEKYLDTNGAVLARDTLYFTHRGPLRKMNGHWVSMRWTAYEASTEPDNFMALGATGSAAEWLRVMENYVAPIQNGLVADRSGNIAIRSSGSFPVRAGNGRGDVVRDGAQSSSDWKGFLPLAREPYSMNPAQGYLASANQQPVDPRVNDAYMGSSWYSPWRAMRINTLLRADSSVTPDDMRRFQTDPGSALADAFVPLFLSAAAHADSIGKSSDALRQAARLLAEWDRRYTQDNRRAVLFETAMKEVARRTWDELIDSAAAAKGRANNFPEPQLMLALARTPTSVWWDDRRTAEVENRDDIVAASLRAGYDSVLAAHGPVTGDGWLWSTTRTANIRHLLRIPALSEARVPVQGGLGTLSPSSGEGTQGASWRMVVELGPEIKAWAIYPGGQSGSPASSRYADRIKRWSRGELEPVLFPKKPEDISRRRVISTLTLLPDRP